MPYIKNSAIQGVKDSIEIVAVTINMDQQVIFVDMRKTTTDGQGIPRVELLQGCIKNESDGVKRFNELIIADFNGTNMYDRLKTGLYTALIDAQIIPSQTAGWSIQ